MNEQTILINAFRMECGPWLCWKFLQCCQRRLDLYNKSLSKGNFQFSNESNNNSNNNNNNNNNNNDNNNNYNNNNNNNNNNILICISIL